MPSCLIIGGADNVKADVAAALELFTPDAIIVVNDQIRDWPGRIDYGVTLHFEKLPGWLPGRRERQRYLPQVWTHTEAKDSDRYLEHWREGSSGLFAVQVALHEGFDRIVLAGVPMVSTRAHYFSPKPWIAASSYQKAWRERHTELQPFVRSMSGFTKELLGEPDADWLGV